MFNFKSQKIRHCFFVCIFVLTLIFSSEALALDFQGVGGRPAYPDLSNPQTQSIFIYSLNPGQIKEDGVLIINDTKETKTLFVYSADSSPATGGSFACKQFGEENKNVGSWIKLEKNEVVLDPMKSKIIPFTVTVPQDIESGEYNGCIAIQEKKPPQKLKGGIRLSTRMAIRVGVVIDGGLIKKLIISDFKISPNPNGGYFTTPYLENKGNISIESDIQLVTRYIFGLKLYEIESSKRTIFRGETGSWNYELKQPILGGWYRTSLKVGYEGMDGRETSKHSIIFFSKPTKTGWIINACIFSVVLVAIFLFWLYRRRKKWIKKDWVEYKVKSGEDINLLAKRFDVSWKLLTKVNKLKPPYTLKVGEKINVPPCS
ncbi:LysM peptidoglycan-binding domain-containing protein [Candidatus Parcubacteria bacterium]|nr:LysM peptidoglycan-binding domain-containing protein [Candidatus Parcubacteria bacterium]